MGELWRIVQGHLDTYGVREAAFARKMDVNPQTINAWKQRGLRRLPERRLLEAVARETRTSYDVVLRAALVDAGYAASATPTPSMSEPAPSEPPSESAPVPPSAEGIESTRGPKIVAPQLRQRKQQRTGTHSPGHSR